MPTKLRPTLVLPLSSNSCFFSTLCSPLMRGATFFFGTKRASISTYLAFDVDPNQAQRADTLKREAERADSLARNYNWQATELRKKIEDLQAALSFRGQPKPESTDELVETS